jgi:hypothetical protein
MAGRAANALIWRVPPLTLRSLSYGANGKIQKMELRRRFAGHYSTVARSTA